jgi:hypothetical protein
MSTAERVSAASGRAMLWWEVGFDFWPKGCVSLRPAEGGGQVYRPHVVPDEQCCTHNYSGGSESMTRAGTCCGRDDDRMVSRIKRRS